MLYSVASNTNRLQYEERDGDEYSNNYDDEDSNTPRSTNNSSNRRVYTVYLQMHLQKNKAYD